MVCQPPPADRAGTKSELVTGKQPVGDADFFEVVHAGNALALSCLALASAGKSMLARMAMIAMTTNNSIRVKALTVSFLICFINFIC